MVWLPINNGYKIIYWFDNWAQKLGQIRKVTILSQVKDGEKFRSCRWGSWLLGERFYIIKTANQVRFLQDILLTNFEYKKNEIDKNEYIQLQPTLSLYLILSTSKKIYIFPPKVLVAGHGPPGLKYW